MVSFIVPVYNAESTLARCIDSILAQSIEQKQIILVNDGSKDNSLSIITSYAEKHTEIVVIDKPNGGVSSARNAGIERALGDYITFIDSDDYYIDENYILNMLTCLLNNSTCDIAISGFTAICDDGERAITPLDEIKDMRTVAEYFQEYRDKNFLNSPWNKLFKKSKIIEQFYIDMTFGEDAVFVFNYLKGCHTVAFCKGCGYGYECRIPSSTAIYRKTLHYDKHQTDKYYKAIAEVLFTFLDKKFALDSYVAMRTQSIMTITQRILHNGVFRFLKTNLNDVIEDTVFQTYHEDIEFLKDTSEDYKIAYWILYNKQSKLKRLLVKRIVQTKIKQIVGFKGRGTQ